VPASEDMAVIAAYLCSDAASHINGCVFGTAGSLFSYWPPARESVIFARDWEKDGRWTWDEIDKCMPTLLKDYTNPSPSEEKQ